MDTNKIKLVEPCAELREAYMEYVEEYCEAEEDYIHGSGAKLTDDFGQFVQMLRDYAEGINLPEGWVPASTYWLVRDGRVLGVSNLRHDLTEFLRHEGGHIGYSVRPTERGKDYATLMVQMVLEKAKELGLERVLITCDKDNVASARVIQKNGGKLESESVSKQTGKLKQRYWIELQGQP